MKTFFFCRAAGALLILTAATSAQAADTDGTVNFRGKIVDTPCTITGTKGNVDVDMASVSTGAVLTNSTPKTPFSIKLTNCSTAIKQSVQVVFSGDKVGPGQLALTKEKGVAQNVAIQLYQNGKTLMIGTQSDSVKLKDGDSDIPFAAQYVNSGGGIPVAGSGNAVAQFTLTYQ